MADSRESTEISAYQDVCNIYNDLLKFKESKQKEYEYTEKNEQEEENVKELKSFHNECEKKYEKFFYSFPILARFIIFSGMFNQECLKKFFKYYYSFKEMPKSYDEFCERQCEYVYLFNLDIITNMCNKNGGRRLKKEMLESKAKKERDSIKDKLVEEYNNFMKLIEEVKVNDKEKDSELKKDRLRNLICSLKQQQQQQQEQ
jgi:hypothetical protein